MNSRSWVAGEAAVFAARLDAEHSVNAGAVAHSGVPFVGDLGGLTTTIAPATTAPTTAPTSNTTVSTLAAAEAVTPT